MATRREIANSDDLLKMRLEKAFERDLRSIFSRIKREYTRRYIARGNILDVSPYFVDFTQSFRKQYERVEDNFLGRVIGNVEDPISSDSEELLASISILLSTQNLPRAQQQAEIVNQTNQQQIDSATRRGIDSAENPSDRTEVAAIASGVLAVNFNARAGTISQQETQIAAENTKAVEARSYSSSSLQDTKTWVTIGDNRVRQTHRAASRQTVAINTPFDVGNSQLQYPSDISLGAELKEVINCRCSAVYNIRRRA